MQDWRAGDKVVCLMDVNTSDMEGVIRLEKDRIYTVEDSRACSEGVGLMFVGLRNHGTRRNGIKWRGFPSEWFRPVKKNLCKHDDSIPADEWFTRICRNRLPVRV